MAFVSSDMVKSVSNDSRLTDRAFSLAFRSDVLALSGSVRRYALLMEEKMLVENLYLLLVFYNGFVIYNHRFGGLTAGFTA